MLTTITTFIYAQQQENKNTFQPYTTSMAVGCSVDWTKNNFISNVSINLSKAGIPIPAGKENAVNHTEMMLPSLVKDPLLSLAVNSEQNLGDFIINNKLSPEQLLDIIDKSHKTPYTFSDSETLSTVSNIDMTKIGSLMVLHKTPYTPQEPIESIASKPFSGIIIDARGKLPVHGEYIQDHANPCFFPKIWDKDMNLIYERNMEDSTLAKTKGIIKYAYTNDLSKYKDRIGTNPLYIPALELFGSNRTDPVISKSNALKILTIAENRELLKQGKIVILLDKDKLISKVSAPLKDQKYYVTYNSIQQYLYNNKVKDVKISDSYKGILVSEDFKFVADSSELLSGEETKIIKIAAILKQITKNNDFTILVEGHTADIGRPVGQMKLSIERTQTIIRELVKNGIPESLFSYKGYGGTKPIASNKTAEGRAQNRRVDITARPKATYIQRDW